MGILRNHKYELFAQGIVAGKSNKEAAIAAGFKGHYGLLRKPEIIQRVDELMASAARRAELSRKQILERIYEDWETSRKLGQMTAALKAADMMGRELHKMFVERKEIGGPGDFDQKSEEELKQIIQDGMKDLGWDEPTPKPSSLN